jgi:hypothetical protein
MGDLVLVEYNNLLLIKYTPSDVKAPLAPGENIPGPSGTSFTSC